ncbi:MAG: hypothetical protein QGG64_13155 [Candidatus Latescibacteria bacterium]|jgi:hypothetical protein|nr:hypothetical protein [Candidatus Latescibacterota bacterium]
MEKFEEDVPIEDSHIVVQQLFQAGMRIPEDLRSRILSMGSFCVPALIDMLNDEDRSFPLTGLDDLSDELRELVFDILRRSPVKEILPLSAYTPSAVATIPITSIDAIPMV